MSSSFATGGHLGDRRPTDHGPPRLPADRGRGCNAWALGRARTEVVSRIHQLLLELIPGGAKKDLSAAQAKALLAKVRPRDAAGKARRRVAAPAPTPPVAFEPTSTTPTFTVYTPALLESKVPVMMPDLPNRNQSR